MAFGMSHAAAGLVIRSGEVELLAMRGKVVTSRVRVPIEGKADFQLGQAIQQAVSAGALKTTRLAVSVPTHEVLFRSFAMPMIPKSEWDTAIQFEARKYMPFKPEELVWDYKVLQTKGAGHLEVIFAAIKRDTFDAIQAVLASAGVSPTLIEPRSLSLARLIEHSKNTNEFTCLVDVDADAAHIAIVKDGLPYLTRDVNLLAASEQPAPSVSLAGVPGAETTQAVDRRAQRLVSELSVSIDFFTREHPSAMISQVVLFGDDSMLGSWCRWLSEQLRCTVELGNAVVGARVDGEIPLSFASAIGLLQPPKDSQGTVLDFLKRSGAMAREVAYQPLSSKGGMPKPAELVAALNTPAVMGMAVTAAAVLLVLWFWCAQQVKTEQMRLQHLVASRPDVGWELNQLSLEELEPRKTIADTQLVLLKQIMTERLSMAEKLDALARTLPDGVWLTGIQFEDRLDAAGKGQSRLTVNGACFLGKAEQELSTIQSFANEVKRNREFAKGFTVTRVEQINELLAPDATYSYRMFQLECSSERRDL